MYLGTQFNIPNWSWAEINLLYVWYSCSVWGLAQTGVWRLNSHKTITVSFILLENIVVYESIYKWLYVCVVAVKLFKNGLTDFDGNCIDCSWRYQKICFKRLNLFFLSRFLFIYFIYKNVFDEFEKQNYEIKRDVLTVGNLCFILYSS